MFAGCYSPELRDCAVRCSAVGGCADGLECGDDDFCHTPGSADVCQPIDGGDPALDGQRADADTTDADTTDADTTDADTTDAMISAPDAEPGVLLVVSASGPGRVQSLANGINCNSSCQYMFPSGTQLTLVPVPQNMSFMFVGWTGDACVAEPAQCTITLTAPTSVTATFSN